MIFTSIDNFLIYLLLFLYLLCFGFWATKASSHGLDNKQKFIIIEAPSSSGELPAIPLSNLDIDILSNPNLPSFVEIPAIGDITIKKTGVAYIGSNPSFEVRLKINKKDLKITSVDLEDSQGKTFNNIPFTVTHIPDSQDTIILGLTLPDNITKGKTTFILTANDAGILIGEIQVIDFFETHILNMIKGIGKPRISRILTRNNEDGFDIIISGKEFVGRKMLYKSKDLTQYLESPPDTANTFLTIFPSSLNAELLKIFVSKDRKILRAKFKLPDKIKNKTKAVLVVSTPRGITSHSFLIRP